MFHLHEVKRKETQNKVNRNCIYIKRPGKPLMAIFLNMLKSFLKTGSVGNGHVTYQSLFLMSSCRHKYRERYFFYYNCYLLFRRNMQGKYFLFLLLQLYTMWLVSCHAVSLASKTGITDGLMTGHEEISWDEERHLSSDENKGIRGFEKREATTDVLISPFPYEDNARFFKREASPNGRVPPFFSKGNHQFFGKREASPNGRVPPFFSKGNHQFFGKREASPNGRVPPFFSKGNHQLFGKREASPNRRVPPFFSKGNHQFFDKREASPNGRVPPFFSKGNHQLFGKREASPNEHVPPFFSKDNQMLGKKK